MLIIDRKKFVGSIQGNAKLNSFVTINRIIISCVTVDNHM